MEEYISWNDYEYNRNIGIRRIIKDIQTAITDVTGVRIHKDLCNLVINDTQLVLSDQINKKLHDGPATEKVYVSNDEVRRRIYERYERLQENVIGIDDYADAIRANRLDPFNTILLGEYQRPKKQIVLYTEAIKEYSLNNKLDPILVEGATLANLLFRVNTFCEAELIGHRIVERGGNKTTLSALAAYFEYEYSKCEFPEIADHLKKEWEKHCCVSWAESLVRPMIDFDEMNHISEEYCAFRKAYYKLITGEKAYSIVEACKNLCSCFS